VRVVIAEDNVLLREGISALLRDDSIDVVAAVPDAVQLISAVDALQPERVVLLPDGVEDAWSEELADLVALA